MLHSPNLSQYHLCTNTNSGENKIHFHYNLHTTQTVSISEQIMCVPLSGRIGVQILCHPILHSVANRSPSLQHLRSSCVALAPCGGDATRLLPMDGGAKRNPLQDYASRRIIAVAQSALSPEVWVETIGDDRIVGSLGIVVSPFRPTSRIEGRRPHHHVEAARR